MKIDGQKFHVLRFLEDEYLFNERDDAAEFLKSEKMKEVKELLEEDPDDEDVELVRVSYDSEVGHLKDFEIKTLLIWKDLANALAK